MRRKEEELSHLAAEQAVISQRVKAERERRRAETRERTEARARDNAQAKGCNAPARPSAATASHNSRAAAAAWAAPESCGGRPVVPPTGCEQSTSAALWTRRPGINSVTLQTSFPDA